LRMEDAICCGGSIVFSVNLDESKIDQLAHPERHLEDGEFWQFHTRIPIKVDAIVRQQHLAYEEDRLWEER